MEDHLQDTARDALTKMLETTRLYLALPAKIITEQR